MRTWWLSCLAFTVEVTERDGLIVAAAPIVRRFRGQRLADLVHWMRRLGGFRQEKLA